MKSKVENINTKLIDWAIYRNGIDPKEYYQSNPKVEKWAKGEDYPTVKQLEDFANKLHVPFGYLFLDNPPDEKIDFPFFRNGVAATNSVSLNVFHTIQIIQDRQDWLTEYMEDAGYHDLDFVGKFNVKSNYLDIVNDMRNVLGIKVDWAQDCENWEAALDFLTERVEEAGIILSFNGIVGLNTHRKISVDECRGFVLVNNKVPFLFVNAADAKGAQMFTIIHELAHIWVGESAGFENKEMLPANDPLELLCDKVAAEFLVPEVYFRQRWESENNFVVLSKAFKVSPIVIGRRALDLGLIKREFFFRFYNDHMAIIKTKKDNSTGGNFYPTVKKRISLRFAAFVNNAVKESKLLYRDAYRLTNLKGETYSTFINQYLY